SSDLVDQLREGPLVPRPGFRDAVVDEVDPAGGVVAAADHLAPDDRLPRLVVAQAAGAFLVVDLDGHAAVAGAVGGDGLDGVVTGEGGQVVLVVGFAGHDGPVLPVTAQAFQDGPDVPPFGVAGVGAQAREGHVFGAGVGGRFHGFPCWSSRSRRGW